VTPTPVPTALPTSLTGDLPNTLCVAGQTYTLGDHDWFDLDKTLSVGDNWPQSGTEWADIASFGRTNNAGIDDSYYPSQAQLSSWGLPPVASLVPGGVAIKSYPAPASPTSDEEAALCSDGTCRGHISGLLANEKSAADGYWVYSVQTPGGNGWWPAAWLLNMTGTPPYNEFDNLEQWGPETIGSNVVQQTEQCLQQCTAGPGLYSRTTVATSSSAQHTYAVLATPTGVGFYVDNTPTTTAFTRYEQSPVSPVMNLQVCTGNSWCPPAPAASATAEMIVRYYAYYAPPAVSTPCSQPYNVPKLL
jgi:hypothetical protein